MTTNKSFRALGIIYIVPPHLADSAISENVRRRKETLEALGYTVYIIEHREKRIMHVCLLLWKLRKYAKHIIIRIDGTSLLDKYTLLRLVLPRHIFIWEIHGFPEEYLEISENFSSRMMVWKNSLKRTLLSFFVDACIFISEEVLAYARKKIRVRHACVIPNYINQPTSSRKSTARFQLPFLLNKNAYIVLWGGDASLPWQATDLIPKIAQEIYQRDKNILFFLVGTYYYHQLSAYKNLVYLQPLPYLQFLSLIHQSHVCLCLYHQPNHIPFYFYPMKLLNYLFAGKPVIATKIGSINGLIKHNVNGFLTDNTIHDIAKTILKLKRNRRLSKKVAMNARRYAATHLSDVQAKSNYRALFQSFL